VDTAPLRAAVEAHVAAARTALAHAVHASAAQDCATIAEFARQSRALLALEAANLSELGAARVQVRRAVGAGLRYMRWLALQTLAGTDCALAPKRL
jgi:hypothetical protein